MSVVEGRARRDEGTAQVLRARWKASYIAAFNEAPIGGRGISESFHNFMRAMGLEEPHHPNAWGANWRALVLRGCLQPTEQTGQMKNSRAHARSHCPVFVKVAHG